MANFYFLIAINHAAIHINQVVALLLIAAGLLRWRERGLTFLLTSAVAITIAVCLAETGKRIMILPGDPGFPSGHETYVMAVSTCLVWRDRRWLPIVVPYCIGMAAILYAAHYHTLLEIAGAVLFGPIVPSVLLAIWRKFGNTENRRTSDF